MFGILECSENFTVEVVDLWVVLKKNRSLSCRQRKVSNCRHREELSIEVGRAWIGARFEALHPFLADTRKSMKDLEQGSDMIKHSFQERGQPGGVGS